MAKPPLDQVGMLTLCTSISVSKRLPYTSVCRTSNLSFLLPQCLWPDPAAYRGLLAQPSLSAPHSKHAEVLGCGTVGAASSERAQPTWVSSCVHGPAFSSFSGLCSQIPRAKPHWLRQGCDPAHQFLTSETSKLLHDICIHCFKLLNLYSLSLYQSKKSTVA